MTTQSSNPALLAGDGHGTAHGHDGPDHVPHILPLKTYLGTWAMLIVLTVITVAASYVDLGGSWNLFLALAIATMKATVVALLFMHLFFDDKFHSVIFGSSLLFLGIFIGFTMMDTETRGRAEGVDGLHPANIAQPFKGGTREDAALRAARSPKPPTLHSEVTPHH